jgi:hypothetical protein
MVEKGHEGNSSIQLADKPPTKPAQSPAWAMIPFRSTSFPFSEETFFVQPQPSASVVLRKLRRPK